MQGSEHPSNWWQDRRVIIGGGTFAGVLALLVIAYLLFMRTDYVVLFQDLRPEQAAAIVEDIDGRGLAYRLRDGGTTILVPEDQADAVRVAIAGSNLAGAGSVGLELFDESDMGLTDFAQKINYQRALQGELVRTIRMMDDIADARVHLALPERTLFRTVRSEPKAAVTLIARDHGRIAPDRVAGIQRLVAAAVPDLSLGQVVVLDEHGTMISRQPARDEPGIAAIDERDAVARYYRARIRQAIETTLPGLSFDVQVRLIELGGGSQDALDQTIQAAEAAPPPAAEAAEPDTAERRNFRLGITVRTAAAIADEDRAILRQAIATAARLDSGRGDALHFRWGRLPTILRRCCRWIGPQPRLTRSRTTGPKPARGPRGGLAMLWRDWPSR